MTTSESTDTESAISDSGDIIDFDHHSAEYAQRWGEIYAGLRQSKCPVARTEAHGGYWVPSRYDDIVAIARDSETFTSEHDLTRETTGYEGVAIPEAPVMQVPIELEGPEFAFFRKLMNPKFSPKEARRYDEFLADATNAALNRVCETGSLDIVFDLGNPVPAIWTLTFLGIPLDNWEECATPFHEIAYQPPGSDEFTAAVIGIMNVLNKVQQEYEDRLATPRDDFLSYLAAAEVDGEPLSLQRVMEICTLVFVGGVDTTTSLTANTMVWLDQHPEERERLRENPDLLPEACEEMLRYFSPSSTLARTVTRETELGGRKLCPGDRILLPWHAANRDPAVFDDPDEVILGRFPNKHTAFGVGPHRCLGSNIARRMWLAMVTGLLTRMPDLSIDHSALQRSPSLGNVNGFISVPATFTPTAPVPTRLTL